MHEPHAKVRLRERYGIDLSLCQFQLITERMGDPWLRSDTDHFRYLRGGRDGIEHWLVNLAAVLHRTFWVPMLYAPSDGNFVTCLTFPESNRRRREARKRVRNARYADTARV